MGTVTIGSKFVCLWEPREESQKGPGREDCCFEVQQHCLVHRDNLGRQWDTQLLEDTGLARPGILGFAPSTTRGAHGATQPPTTDEQNHHISLPLFQAGIISREMNSSVAARGCTGVVTIRTCHQWLNWGICLVPTGQRNECHGRHRHRGDAGWACA